MINAETAFEDNRIRINSQYASCPQRFHTTNAASKNEDKNGPINTTQRQNRPTLRRVVKRMGPPIRYRIKPAPITASQELLMNQHKVIRVGTYPGNWVPKGVGREATRQPTSCAAASVKA